MTHLLSCQGCSQRTPATVFRLRCETCDDLLEISYDKQPAGKRARSPLADFAQTVSLGEGLTPSVALARTGKALGVGNLTVKLEFMAPTGSFKDRGSAVLVSAAVSEGVSEFVEDSSGNAGASLSAYAAAAGMKAHVFVPASAATGKLEQIRIFGAELHAVDGPRQAATDAAEAFVANTGMPYLSHNLSPYFSEGMKQFAYEIVADADQEVRHIVLPVGNGSLLIGAKAGFDELLEAGVIERIPSFHAVQVSNVQPIAAAINGVGWDPRDAKPTVASGIAVSTPPRLAQCVAAVQESGGTSVTVGEEETLNWQRRLAADEGIFCEATSAAAFAGLQRLTCSGVIRDGESVLVPVTGTGLKEPVRG